MLLFDEEHRQRQAVMGFPWGTEAPDLSTVLLRDRQQGTAGSTQQRRPYGQGQGGHQARPVGATGRDLPAIQHQRGVRIWQQIPSQLSVSSWSEVYQC